MNSYTREEFKNRYFAVIGLFYFGQGYSLASLLLLLPIYILTELGVQSRSEAVAVSALIVSPWYVKFIFGILSDYVPIKNLRRKPYLVIATLFSLLGWSTLGMHTRVTPMFIFSGFLLALGSAMGDSTIDGQSVEITPLSYTGRLQGVAWGSRGLGIGSAGILSSQIVANYGWQTMFSVAGVFGVSITVIALLLPERPKFDFEGVAKFTHLKDNLIQIFSKHSTKHRILFFFLTGTVLSTIIQLTLIMETEFAYSIEQIGWGAFTFAVGSFIGAILYGILTDRGDTLKKFSILSSLFGVTIISGLYLDRIAVMLYPLLLFMESIVSSPILAQLIFYPVLVAQFLYFFFMGFWGGAYEGYQLKIIQEQTEANFESTTFAIWTGISNLGQLAFGNLVIIGLADLLNTSVLFMMQLVLIILLITHIPLSHLKFNDH